MSLEEPALQQNQQGLNNNNNNQNFFQGISHLYTKIT